MCYDNRMDKNGNYIATVEDLDSQALVDISLGEDLEPIAHRLGLQVASLQRLIRRDDLAIEQIRQVKAELEESIRLAMLMMVPGSLSTLKDVMDDIKSDSKTAGARVKAVEVILDRSGFPKSIRRQVEDVSQPGRKALPDLEELIEQADDDQDAAEIVKRHRRLMKEIDEMRHGARMIVDA